MIWQQKTHACLMVIAVSWAWIKTVQISQVHITFKNVQIILFEIYLFYFYNLYKEITTASLATKKQSKNLFMIAVAMGATVSLSQFIWRMHRLLS